MFSWIVTRHVVLNDVRRPWCISQHHRRLLWRHNGNSSVSNHQPHDCSLNRLFRRKSKKTSKLRVTGLCAGNSPGTGEFPRRMASNAEDVSIWWRHHGTWQTPRRNNGGEFDFYYLQLEEAKFGKKTFNQYAFIYCCNIINKAVIEPSHRSHNALKTISHNIINKAVIEPSHRSHNALKTISHNALKTISHNAPFCKRNVHTCAYFCYNMVHYGILNWCIVGFVQQVYTTYIHMQSNSDVGTNCYMHHEETDWL